MKKRPMEEKCTGKLLFEAFFEVEKKSVVSAKEPFFQKEERSRFGKSVKRDEWSVGAKQSVMKKIRTCHYCKTYFQKYKNLPEILRGGFCAGSKQGNLLRLAHDRFGDLAGTEATGAYGNCANFSIGKLVTHPLQVRIEDTIGLDVGVADIMAGLRFFTAHFTLLGHGILPYIRTVARKNPSGAQSHNFARHEARAKRNDLSFLQKKSKQKKSSVKDGPL